VQPLPSWVLERFDKGEVYGHQPGLRCRIALT